MKFVRFIVRALVLAVLMPLCTYWFIAKRSWAHTPLEVFLLIGLMAGGLLMFVASNRPIDRQRYQR